MNVLETVYTPSGQPISVVDKKDVGFNGMKPEDFLKLMIVQLQNQDPTEPTSNEELLGQISQMRSLQSSMELEKMIKLLADSQTSSASTAFASSAASLIGRQVTGMTEERTGETGETIAAEKITGVVDRAILKDGKAYVGIGNHEIPISNILEME